MSQKQNLLSLSRGLSLPLARLVGLGAPVLGIEKSVPESEEGLSKVGLDAPVLVVDVVIGGVVGKDVMDRVVRKFVTAVVEDGLDGRSGEEPHGLAHRHPCEKVSESAAKGVESEAFKWVVVQSAICVGDIEAMVTGMKGDCCCQLNMRM